MTNEEQLVEITKRLDELDVKIESHLHRWSSVTVKVKKIYQSKEFWAAMSLAAFSILQYFNTMPNLTPQMTAVIGVAYAIVWTVLRVKTNSTIELPAMLDDKRRLELDDETRERRERERRENCKK
jgi:hypothetical protein